MMVRRMGNDEKKNLGAGLMRRVCLSGVEECIMGIEEERDEYVICEYWETI